MTISLSPPSEVDSDCEVVYIRDRQSPWGRRRELLSAQSRHQTDQTLYNCNVFRDFASDFQALTNLLYNQEPHVERRGVTKILESNSFFFNSFFSVTP